MDIKTAIENYLSITSSKGMDEETRTQRLTASLDELAMLSHKVQYNFDDADYPDPPEKRYKETREKMGNLFPSLGYYNVALDISDKMGGSSISIGDAIDDLTDIAGDLQEIIWRYENTSKDDALFYFRNTFRTHWGMHLRKLQLYLHDLHGGWTA
jgi:hypothetical protein